MISPSSLPAFSPAITGTPSAQATRVAAVSPGNSPPAQKTLQALPSGAAPGRPTPRGSLLDLSV